jgi:hypothetical protein
MGGRNLGVATSQSCAEIVTLDYIATSVTQPMFVAAFPCICTGLTGRQRVNGGSGAQITFYKCASGVAAANGVLLHSGIFDASTGGTADANQFLTLVTDQTKLTFAPGDALMCLIAGTMTAAVGMVQGVFEPLT